MHVAGYKLIRRLASGTSGTVYAAEAPSSAPATPAARVAVKLVPAARVSPAVLREVVHLQGLAHPGILALHRVARVPAPAPAPAALALVTELLPAGDLFDAVARAGARLDSRFVRLVARDVARALLYLKRRRVVHADIKLENVGLAVGAREYAAGAEAGAVDPDEELRDHAVVAKILDFGTSRPPATLDSAHDNARPIGTALYLAPELLRPGVNREPPSHASDAWALGVLLYATLCGWYPFEPEPTTESDASDDESAPPAATPPAGSMPSTEAIAFAADYASDAILNLPPRPLPPRVPADLRALVYGLLRKDASARMTVEGVVAQLGGETAAEARGEREAKGSDGGRSRGGTGVKAWRGWGGGDAGGRAAAAAATHGRAASAAVAIPGAAAAGRAAVACRRGHSPLSVSDPVFDSSSAADSEEAQDDLDDVCAVVEEEDGEEELEAPNSLDDHVVPARSQTLDDMVSIVEHIQRQLSDPTLLSRSPARGRTSS